MDQLCDGAQTRSAAQCFSAPADIGAQTIPEERESSIGLVAVHERD